MTVSTEMMTAWCQKLLDADNVTPQPTLDQFLKAIPALDSLANLPSGTPVLVRGDVDAKPGPTLGEGDIRLRSMKETLDFGIRRGWIQIIFGHIGRAAEGSLKKVRDRLAEILGRNVDFVDDWLDPQTATIKDQLAQLIKKSPPGSVIMLENTRKYDIERVLWKAKPADLPKLAGALATVANEFAAKVAKVYVHEGFSAGNLDTSSVVVPAAMDRVALGRYLTEQFANFLTDCLNAQMVVFSGLKIDKLDNLEAMMNRGKIRNVITAGSVAMSLKKAAAQLDGGDFNLGLTEDTAKKDEPYYIPPERIDQAKELLRKGRKDGVEFVMPVDFVLGDGSVAETLGPGQQQFDVGPKSSQLFEEAVGRFLKSHAGAAKPAVVFDNGVFGMFEDPRFEEGTKKFTRQLKRMTDAGVKVYVGGGEGGTAVEKYGKPDWITYCFTAGGTVLKVLGGKTIPYLLALKMAAQKGRCPDLHAPAEASLALALPGASIVRHT